MVALAFVACGGEEPDVPGPNPPVETKDTKAPTLSIKVTEKNVIA